MSDGAAVVTTMAATAAPGDVTLSITPPTGSIATRMTGHTSAPRPNDDGNITGYNTLIAKPHNPEANNFTGTMPGTTLAGFLKPNPTTHSPGSP